MTQLSHPLFFFANWSLHCYARTLLMSDGGAKTVSAAVPSFYADRNSSSSSYVASLLSLSLSFMVMCHNNGSRHPSPPPLFLLAELAKWGAAFGEHPFLFSCFSDCLQACMKPAKAAAKTERLSWKGVISCFCIFIQPNGLYADC